MYSSSHQIPGSPLEAYYRGEQRRQSAGDIKIISLSRRTMESARAAFHAQLATVMDSLLAAAVCEIAKIFESSFCEQQVALAQKTDEIATLRGKLEKLVRRQRARVGGSEEGEMSPGDGEGTVKQLSGSGLNVELDASSHLDPVERLTQSLRGLKEEVTGHEETSVKLEIGVPSQSAVSHPSLGHVGVKTPEGSLAAGDQRQMDSLSARQAKANLSQWDQGSHSADHRPIQYQASTPFLSISQSGRCSPRPDPSPAHPEELLPGLDNQDGVSGLENPQTDGTSCSGTDASCFQPAFVSDETNDNDGNGSFPFLDQEPENHNSNHESVDDQGEGQQVQPLAHSGESTWTPRDDRVGRGPVNHIRRVTSLGSRDPLRPQSNLQSLTQRHATDSHPALQSGGNGRPYTCPYCTKCFTYPSHQRRHLLRHTGVRLHPCQFCDKSFLTPSELTVHTRTHTGERPFGCAQCGKRFARSGNLRAHQRDVHMGKRPFACTECGKRFAHRGNLRVHNHRVHQGDPYFREDQQDSGIVHSSI